MLFVMGSSPLLLNTKIIMTEQAAGSAGVAIWQSTCDGAGC